jgi:hypothetical protein
MKANEGKLRLTVGERERPDEQVRARAVIIQCAHGRMRRREPAHRAKRERDDSYG